MHYRLSALLAQTCRSVRVCAVRIHAARRRRWDQPLFLGQPLESSRSTAETVNPSVTQRLPVTKQLVCYPHKQQLHNCPSTPNSAVLDQSCLVQVMPMHALRKSRYQPITLSHPRSYIASSASYTETRAERSYRRPTRPRPFTSQGDVISIQFNSLSHGTMTLTQQARPQASRAAIGGHSRLPHLNTSTHTSAIDVEDASEWELNPTNVYCRGLPDLGPQHRDRAPTHASAVLPCDQTLLAADAPRLAPSRSHHTRPPAAPHAPPHAATDPCAYALPPAHA